MNVSGAWRSGGGICSSIGAASVSAAGVSIGVAAPDDHFTAGPHCRVKASAGGRTGGAGGGPTICDGVISPTGVQKGAAVAAADDHFAAGPDCRVNVSGAWRADDAGGCPTVRAGIVSPARVKEGAPVPTAPDDHFAASPHCRVSASANGRAGRASGCPRIINASVWAGRYDGKGIATSNCRDWLSFLVFRAPSPGVQRFLITFVDFS